MSLIMLLFLSVIRCFDQTLMNLFFFCFELLATLIFASDFLWLCSAFSRCIALVKVNCFALGIYILFAGFNHTRFFYEYYITLNFYYYRNQTLHHTKTSNHITTTRSLLTRSVNFANLRTMTMDARPHILDYKYNR